MWGRTRRGPAPTVVYGVATVPVSVRGQRSERESERESHRDSQRERERERERERDVRFT